MSKPPLPPLGLDARAVGAGDDGLLLRSPGDSSARGASARRGSHGGGGGDSDPFCVMSKVHARGSSFLRACKRLLCPCAACMYSGMCVSVSVSVSVSQTRCLVSCVCVCVCVCFRVCVPVCVCVCVYVGDTVRAKPCFFSVWLYVLGSRLLRD